MYQSYEFVYAGLSSAMFGMYVADMPSNKHSANSFGNKANLVETRLANRVAPIHYGVRYNDTVTDTNRAVVAIPAARKGAIFLFICGSSLHSMTEL